MAIKQKQIKPFRAEKLTLITEMSKLAALDLFIRPDGLPVTFVVTSSRAQLRSKVNISKRKVLM